MILWYNINNMNFRLAQYANILFRLALAGIFFYFGINNLINPEIQAQILLKSEIQEVIMGFSTLKTAMIILGVVQIIIAVFILLGLYLKIFLSLAAILLIGMIINSGFNEASMRDAIILAGILYFITHEY